MTDESAEQVDLQIMRPEVAVHHLDQATAALRVAVERGVDIQLKSAPGAAASAGVGYLQALGEAVGQELLIDCRGDAGLVMAAFRSGCGMVMFSGSGDERQRLGQMANRCGALLRGPADPSLPCLELLPEDNEVIVHDWLDAVAETVKASS